MRPATNRQSQLESAVFGVPEEHLVAGSELERPCDRVQRRAGVRHEGEVLRTRADVRRETALGRVEELREAALEGEELDRLPLELALEPLVGLEHGHGARAERAVVQEHHIGVEQEFVAVHS